MCTVTVITHLNNGHGRLQVNANVVASASGTAHERNFFVLSLCVLQNAFAGFVFRVLKKPLRS